MKLPAGMGMVSFGWKSSPLATHQVPETTTQSRSVSYQCGALRCILTPFDAAHLRQINIGFKCKFLLRPRRSTDRTDTATGRSNACI
jgi:hypothetical protein